MLEEPALLRIKTRTNAPSPEQLAAFRSAPSCMLNDALLGQGALDRSVQPIDRSGALPRRAIGRALTVQCGPGDILALMAALKFVKPGDIVVAAFNGFQGCAVMGDRVAGMLLNNKAAGFVTDGPVRDIDGLLTAGLPVWASGLTPASPVSNGPGSIGLPVQIAGQRVETGDIIIADADGVVVAPFARLDELGQRIEHIMELEQALDDEVRNGLKIAPRIQALLDSDQVDYFD